MTVTERPGRVRRLVGLIDPWAPPLVLMAVIFWLSHQPDLDSGLGTIDAVGRKFVHAAEFGALAALWWRAVRPRRGALALAAAIAVAYAASDEWHQTFVDGRSGSGADVLIDSAGVAIAVLLIRARR